MNDKLFKIIANVLEMDVKEVNEDFSESSSEKWDSLAQLMMMEEIETEFKVNIPIEDVMELTSVKRILEFLEHK